jgi:hypothetical protein
VKLTTKDTKDTKKFVLAASPAREWRLDLAATFYLDWSVPAGDEVTSLTGIGPAAAGQNGVGQRRVGPRIQKTIVLLRESRQSVSWMPSSSSTFPLISPVILRSFFIFVVIIVCAISCGFPNAQEIPTGEYRD